MSKVNFIGEQAQFKPVVSRLKLESFRGFSELDIDLKEDLTVFISRNGGGKSTILDAIWGGLSEVSSVFDPEKDNNIDQVLHSYDVKNGVKGSTIDLGLDVFYQWFAKPKNSEEEEGDLTLEEGQKRVLIQLTGNEKGFSVKRKLTEEWAELTEFLGHGYTSADSKPIFRYYGAKGLDNGKNQLVAITTWMDRRQKVLTQSANKSFSRQLNWVKEAVSSLLTDEEVSYTDFKVAYGVEEDYLSITKKQGDEVEELGVQQLSSGEIYLLEIVADIAIALIEANPEQDEAFNPLGNGFGVVLIDEVGIHLHPSWQRSVLVELRAIFPNIQFIASTHSGLLLNNISSNQIWLLDDWRAVRPDATFGRDISTIISKVMDTPSNEFEKKYKHIYRLLARNEISKAEAELRKIEEEFKASGDDYSPELRKLLAILERKKILEK